MEIETIPLFSEREDKMLENKVCFCIMENDTIRNEYYYVEVVPRIGEVVHLAMEPKGDYHIVKHIHHSIGGMNQTIKVYVEKPA